MTDPLPAPTTPLTLQTQTAFTAQQLITSSCHAVVNTQLLPPPTKPPWFDDLNAKLDAAKVVCNQWIDTLGPDATGSIPAQVTNYGTTYTAFADEIQSIATQYPDATGPDDPHVQAVQQLAGELVSGVGTVLASIDATAATLKTWGTALQTAHDNLATGASNIQAAETALQVDIQKMNTAIQTLNTEIDEQNKAIAYAAGAIGVGLLLLVVGVALAPETGGASLVVAGTGGLAIIGGAVTWGVMQSKINTEFGEIAKDQAESDADTAQLKALQGLSSASSSAISSLAIAGQALSDFRTSFATLEQELQAVVAKLELAEGSLSTLVGEAFTDAATREWNDAVTFAQGLAELDIQVETQTLPMAS